MKCLTPFNLIEYSSVIEQTIEHIEILKSILKNQQTIQTELIEKWLTDITAPNRTNKINIESSVLMNRLSENDFILTNQLDLSEQAYSFSKEFTSIKYKKYEFFKSDFNINAGFSTLILLEQENLFTDFRLNLSQKDKIFIEITIVGHIFESLFYGFLCENSYKLFYNDLIFLKKDHLDQTKLFTNSFLKIENMSSTKSESHRSLIKNLNETIRKKRSCLTNAKLQLKIKSGYSNKWITLNKNLISKKIDETEDTLIQEKIEWKKKIDNEKVANFLMIESIRNQISKLNETEKSFNEKYESIDEIQLKINTLKDKVIKQKALIVDLQNKIDITINILNESEEQYSSNFLNQENS